MFDPFQKKNYELHHCFFQPLSASTESNLGSLDTVPAAEIGEGDPFIQIAVRKKRLQPRSASEVKISLKGLLIE